MNNGMLWFDDDPHTAISVKVNRAANYYRSKYGHIPDLCLVNPSMLTSQSDLIEGHVGKVAVRTNKVVLPGHLWIGSEEI
jgi:hypothetical protein